MELGVVGIQSLEFVPHTVKFSIADLGLCKVVVQVRMARQFLCKRSDSAPRRPADAASSPMLETVPDRL